MKKKIYFILVSLLFFISCKFKNNQEVIVDKEFSYYINKDSLGNIIAEGPVHKKKTFGEWKYYNGDNILDSIVNYVCYRGGYNTEKTYVFNFKGDTIGGHYYESILKDTIVYGNNIRYYFFLRETLNDKTFNRIYFLYPNRNEEGIKLDSCLSNREDFVFDTILSLGDRFRSKNKYQDRYGDVMFEDYRPELGEHELRGILMEQHLLENGKFLNFEFFIKENFYVKDSIPSTFPYD